MQRGNARQVRDLFRSGKDHPAGVRVLLQGAVYPQPDGEALRIGHLGGRRDPRTERTAAFEALVRGPVEMERVPRRQRAAPRKVARGKIVCHRVARDVIERLLDWYVARRPADDRSELGFPVELLRAARSRDPGARPDHAGAGLDEEPGLQAELARILRQRQILGARHLGDVVGVVRAGAVDRSGIKEGRVQRSIAKSDAFALRIGESEIREKLLNGGARRLEDALARQKTRAWRAVALGKIDELHAGSSMRWRSSSSTVSGTGMPSCRRCFAARAPRSPGSRISIPGCGGKALIARASRPAWRLNSPKSTKRARSSAITAPFWRWRAPSAVRSRASARSGLALTRLVMHSIRSERPEPLAPPSGRRMAASPGSVLGLPFLSSAWPCSSAVPVRLACLSFPMDRMLEAMSSAIGPFSPGTARASGAVETPAARAPW